MRRVVAAIAVCLLMAGCSQQEPIQDGTGEQESRTLLAVARDKPAPPEEPSVQHGEAPQDEQEDVDAEEADDCAYEQAYEECGVSENVSETAVVSDGLDGEWYAEYNELYGSNGPTHSMPGWHDGRVETYYSSNVLYHYRTGEWTVDEEGFYRTDEGYYVVGVSTGDYELGDTFEGGKGTCYVADFGDTSEPVTDYYTNW